MTTGKRLTPAQVRALRALAKHPGGAISIAMRGGKPLGWMPSGIWSTATLHALSRRGLASMRYAGAGEHWSITEAGRSALSEAEET
jgi:hypothetical protein